MAEHVVCHGSGRIDEALIPKYNSPFAIETATFKIKDSDVCAEVTRSLFATARQYRESFDAYGSKKSFEWQQVEGEEPVIHTIGLPEPEVPPSPGARLRPPPARADPAVHDQGGLQRGRRAAPLVSPRGAATAARTRTSSTPGSPPSKATAPPCPTPKPRPTGRWSASAPTSRPSRTARRSSSRPSDPVGWVKGPAKARIRVPNPSDTRATSLGDRSRAPDLARPTMRALALILIGRRLPRPTRRRAARGPAAGPRCTRPIGVRRSGSEQLLDPRALRSRYAEQQQKAMVEPCYRTRWNGINRRNQVKPAVVGAQPIRRRTSIIEAYYGHHSMAILDRVLGKIIALGPPSRTPRRR